MSASTKLLASTKYTRWQNTRVDKMLVLTKYQRGQNVGVDKILVATKCWRRKNGADTEESPYCLARQNPQLLASAGLLALLKISYLSLMVLLSLHAVVKWGIASSRPAFMGGLSPVLYRLIVLVRHAENVQNFGAWQNIGARLKFTDFCQSTAVYISISQMLTITVQCQFFYSRPPN